MKATLKSLFVASLLLASTAASAQKVIVQDLEDWMGSLISRAIDNNVEVSKNFGQERDIQKEGTPLKWRCDIMTFTLPKKQRPLLDEMIKAFEANGHDNPNCYGINTKITCNLQNEGRRNLIIGDDINRYVTIGKDYGNFVNVNILDANDTTKTHRYAYALEWKEDHKGKVIARYIVTYAKIPSAYTATIQSRPQIDMDIFHIPKTEPIQAPNKAQAWKLIKGNLDSIRISYDDLKPFINYNMLMPRDSVELINQTLNDGNFLLNFYNLNNYYWKNKTTNLTAISIYRLCKLGREHGAFKDSDSLEEWEQVMVEIDKLIECAKNETDRKYFQMAREQLEKMK